MIAIRRTTKVYIDNKASWVLVTARWQSCANQVSFSIGIKWDKSKWDEAKQRPKINTTCDGISCKELCKNIDAQIDAIEKAFALFEAEGHMPNKQEFRDSVSAQMKGVGCSSARRINYDVLFEKFMNERKEDRNWRPNSSKKYLSLWNNLHKICPEIFASNFSKSSLTKLKRTFIDKGYSNTTTVRAFKSIRAILTYFRANGIDVDDSVLNYKVKLQQIPKTIISLDYEEFMALYKFEFKSERLERVKDAFCFMAATALRFSDMQNLRWDNVFDDHIETITQKTLEPVTIPLISVAKEILDKIKQGGSSTGNVFHRISNAQFNNYIKEAAKEVKLEREITIHRISGTTAITKKEKICDVISAHSGRKTFVSVAIGLGIPPTIVMSITGHSDYDQMRPYINVSDETKKKEMMKFEKQPENEVKKAENNSTDEFSKFIESLSPEERIKLMKLSKLMNE